MAAASEQSESRLLRLPPEIRNLVWEYAVQHYPPFMGGTTAICLSPVSVKHTAAITQTSRQVRSETRAMYFARSEFFYQLGRSHLNRAFLSYMITLGPEACDSITCLNIRSLKFIYLPVRPPGNPIQKYDKTDAWMFSERVLFYTLATHPKTRGLDVGSLKMHHNRRARLNIEDFKRAAQASSNPCKRTIFNILARVAPRRRRYTIVDCVWIAIVEFDYLDFAIAALFNGMAATLLLTVAFPRQLVPSSIVLVFACPALIYFSGEYFKGLDEKTVPVFIWVLLLPGIFAFAALVAWVFKLTS